MQVAVCWSGFFFFVVFLASALKYGFYRGEGKGGDRAILPTIKKKKN